MSRQRSTLGYTRKVHPNSLFSLGSVKFLVQFMQVVSYHYSVPPKIINSACKFMKDLAEYDVFDNLADLESWFSIFLSS